VGSSTEDPEGYVEKALESGISIGAPVGNLQGGSFTRDFERWMKGSPAVELLYGSSVKGTWWGDFITGNSGKYVEKALEMGISVRAPLGNLERGSYTGDVER